MSDNQIISSERLGLWTAVSFTLALLALILAVISLYRTNTVLYGTQIEVLALNKKIESMRAAPAPATENKAQAPSK